MKHFDLFSGYGGFTLALERVYANLQDILHPTEHEHEAKNTTGQLPSWVESNNETRLGDTIGFSEIDKYASAVLKYHWPNTKNYGDITKINWAEVPDFDLLTGGSPCQDLSIAGKRAGLEGERSGLFYKYMRAVREKKPKYFIWENVKGALSSNKGFDFLAVLNEMAEAGYSLWWQVLNAKDFGVPQNRERIFVVGFRDRPAPEVFFERENDTISNKEDKPETRRSQTEISGTLKACGGVKADDTFIKVIGDLRGGGWEKRTESSRRIYDPSGISPTIPTCQGGGLHPKLLKNSKIRRLTPLECERLMGLPDNWLKYGDFGKDIFYEMPITGLIDCEYKSDIKEISDNQRYKMAGNGVVVNVVEEIIKNIILK